MTQRIIRRAACVLPLLATAWSVRAEENGCYHLFNSNYQLGQTQEILVTNAMVPGEIVRESSAHGDGSIMASCMAGTATFEGQYIVPVQDGLVPLTVRGQPSGFGIEVFLTERGDARQFAFPHRYTRAFANPAFLRSDEVEVGYRVRRMAGEVAFGPVDQQTIAQQWSYNPAGARTPAFRHLKVYELAFIRAACEISAESLTQEVDVGAWNASAFANADRATPWRPFAMVVSECADPVGLIARFTFGTPGDADKNMPEIFSLPARGPENVGLELADDDRRRIRPGVPVSFNALGTGKAFGFNVRLKETRDTVRGGTFRRPVTVLAEFR